jgi:hypothetical protein
MSQQSVFLENINQKLKELGSKLKVFEQRNYFSTHFPSCLPESDKPSFSEKPLPTYLNVHSENGDHQFTIEALDSDQNTIKMICQLEKIANDFYQKGKQEGRDEYAFELRQFLGIRNEMETFS